MANYGYSNSGEHVAMLYSSGKQMIPSYIVLAQNEDPIWDFSTQSFTIVRVKRGKFSALKKKFEDGLRNPEILLSNKWLSRIAHRRRSNNKIRYIVPDTLVEFEYSFEKVEKFFDVQHFYGREEFFVHMTTEVGISESHFESLFGQKPIMERDVEFIGSAEIIYSPTIRKNNKNTVQNILEHVHMILKKQNFDDIFCGTIRVTPKLLGNAIGKYYIETDDIRVQPSVKDKKRALFTLLHEIGHKYYYTRLFDNGRRDIARQYDSVKHINPDPQHQRHIKDQLDSLNVGVRVEYIGHKKSYKNLGTIFEIIEDDEEVHVAPVGNHDVYIHGHKEFLLNGEWSLDGVRLTNRIPTHELVSGHWFPRSYSKENASEWFADSFAVYILGNMRGEPKIWFDEFFKTHHVR